MKKPRYATPFATVVAVAIGCVLLLAVGTSNVVEDVPPVTSTKLTSAGGAVATSTEFATSAPLTAARTSGADATRNSAPSLTLRQAAKAGGGVNGVILFLHGGRWHKYFVRECLPRLDAYLLRCFPYPVHVFHEKASPEAQSAIRAAMPHAPLVDFEDVGWIWKSLPKPITESLLERWMSEGVQPHFAKRGYRVMCRFWAGLVWTLPSLDKYDVYWRLDTDSVLTRPVTIDPFVHVFRERRCEYGFNKLKGENMLVATGIYDAFSRWADEAGPAVLSPAARERVRKFAVDPATGKYWGPMYYNNFEMGTIALKRSAVYQGFFRYVDSHEPYGIFRYRWGDAPLHTLGVVAALDVDRICNVTQDVVGYKHAAKRFDPIPSELPTCRPSGAPRD